MPNFIAMRQNMVKGQIMPEEVTNPALLDAFLKVPRELFLPRQLARIAYMDLNFPLQKGRVLLRPATIARLLQAASLKPSDKVLYIASNTGYGPALLGQIGLQVIALDSEEFFTQTSEQTLQELKFSSVEVVLGPLEKGWKGQAPFNKIIIEGSVDFIPKTLKSQLKEEGTLITLRHRKGQGSDGVRYIKKGAEFNVISLFDAFAPRLKAFCQQKTFVF